MGVHESGTSASASGVPFGYAEALAALEAAARFGMNPQLETMIELCETLGRPQDRFASIQVTGTNGKSSTTRAVAALLRAHGLETGTYTSPELVEITERIEIDGCPVTPDAFASGIQAALAAAESLRQLQHLPDGVVVTQFELLTAAALWLFAHRAVQFACLEVGMGGRWDATSVVAPAVAVITGVALDHTDHLGTSRLTIAQDKAYVIKPGSAPILGPGTSGVDAAFLARAEACGTHARAVRERGAPSPVPEELTVRFETTARPDRPGGVLRLDVVGAHGAYRGLSLRAPSYQAANVATAIAAAEAALGRALDADATRLALAGLRFPGRFELVSHAPPVVIDGAHNPEAAAVLARAIREAWRDPARRPVLLLGILADKDAAGIVEALRSVASEFVVTQSSSPRALPAADLAALVLRTTGTPARAYASVAEALDAVLPSAVDGVVVSGSITTAGEAARHLRSA